MFSASNKIDTENHYRPIRLKPINYKSLLNSHCLIGIATFLLFSSQNQLSSVDSKNPISLVSH